MRVDISGWELHNIVKQPNGQLRTRRALASLKTPSAGTQFVAGFTVDSPSSTEPWHYLFEQSTTDGTTTLRVFTEEFLEMFNYPLGQLQQSPVITHAVQYGQIMIGSPAFSFTLYGQVGGGLTTAIKTPSINPDTTALDIPEGHVCAFGDRTVIARGNNAYINDPPATQGANLDPRTFVAQNAVPLPGTILDIFQADDGALRIFTTAGAWKLPADALGAGAAPSGALQRIPGVDTMRPRNAVASNGQVFVLERDGVAALGGSTFLSPTQPTRLPIPVYDGSRFYSQVVAVDDLRLAAELYPTADGFLVGFRARRGHYLNVNVKTGSFYYVTSVNSSFNVVGALRSRDGETMPVFADRVVVETISGRTDYDGFTVRGVACGRIDLDGQRPEVRRVIVTAGNASGGIGAYIGGAPLMTLTTSPTLTGEAVIGTTLWNTAPTQRLLARRDRGVRLSFAARITDPQMEIVVADADRHISPLVDVIVNGQGRDREDKN